VAELGFKPRQSGSRVHAPGQYTAVSMAKCKLFSMAEVPHVSCRGAKFATQTVSLCNVDYFRLVIFKKQMVQEENSQYTERNGSKWGEFHNWRR